MEEESYSSHLDPLMGAVLFQTLLPPKSRVLFVPLDNDDHESWMKFKNLDDGNPMLRKITPKLIMEAIWPIELDHPIVPVMGQFAIAAFNELSMLFVKKGISENIREAEIIEVKYLSVHEDYVFSITLEAMEEDVLGVYEARVLCNHGDGMRSLLKFYRTPRRVVGEKAKRLAQLIRLQSRYTAVKGQMNDVHAELETRYRAMKGKKKAKAAAELINLRKEYKAMEGICHKLQQRIDRLKPTGWKMKRSNSDDWPVPDKLTGMRLRCQENTSWGYDYYARSSAFDPYLIVLGMEEGTIH